MAVRKKKNTTLTYGNIIQLIELIYQRPNNSHIDPHIPQLLQAQIILHHAGNVPPNTMNVGIHWQMTMRVRHTAVYTISRLVSRAMIV